MYDPSIDFNRDPRCDCIHPENDHDPKTGRCLKMDPIYGECPCRAGREEQKTEEVLAALRKLAEELTPCEEVLKQTILPQPMFPADYQEPVDGEESEDDEN